MPLQTTEESDVHQPADEGEGINYILKNLMNTKMMVLPGNNVGLLVRVMFVWLEAGNEGL